MISDCVACVVVDCAPAVIVVLPGCDWNDIALVKTKKNNNKKTLHVLVRSLNDRQK